MARVFSGIQPSGDIHLGNYLGAVANWAKIQHVDESVYCIVDLHALTTRPNPEALRQATTQAAQALVASGLDPDVCTIFAQSSVPHHSELAWIMQCNTAYGELGRMTQFKDKSGRQDFISSGLFSYPALQAADILLYDTERVPVGDDQRQHIELTRDVAERFNNRFGEVFVIPEHVIPAAGARVMDLQNPTDKMSKSIADSAGTIWLHDDPKTIEKKFKRAVTDSDNEVAFDFEKKPGVSNLLSILAACTDTTPEAAAEDYEQYGYLKLAAAEAVIERLRPIQARRAELEADPAATAELLEKGRQKALAVAAPVMDRVKAAVGIG